MFLMYPRFLQLFLNNQIENLEAVFNDEYDTPSHTKKVFANMRRQGKDFPGIVTPLFATMLIQPQAVEGEGSGQPTEPQHTPTTASPSNIEPIPIIASSSHPKKTHKRYNLPNVEVSFFKLLCTTDDIEDMTFDVYALPCYGLVLFVMALFIHAL
ncbi:hypothetical protein Tco_0958908 [Tanacetum coccineum]